jgi:uncharacterized membrane protein
MLRDDMQYKILYTVILGGLIFIFVASLGSGVWDRPLNYSDWQYKAFRGVCHQMPERSFHIHDTPMAVNTRCFGIFSGLLGAWLLIPVLVFAVNLKKWPGILLSVAVAVQVIDYAASQLSVWNSSNFSRFFLGIFLGVTLVCMLADQFRNNK